MLFRSVPTILETALDYMNNMCYKGLKKANSALSIPKRDAYAILTNYAKNNHPNFISNPRSLVKTTPLQKRNKSVEEFQLQFLDHLQMSAYITGSTAKFDDKDTIALFVEQLADSDKIMNLYRIELNVPENKPLYQPDMIVSTVKRLLQECALCQYSYYPKKAVVGQLQMDDIKQQNDEENQDEEEDYSPSSIPTIEEASFNDQVMIYAINAIYSDPNLKNAPQCIVCKILDKGKEKGSEEAKQMYIA